MRPPAIWVFLGLLVGASEFVAAAILDPETRGPENALLVPLNAPLDLQEVDIILGEAKSHALGQRARLAPLTGFSTGSLDWGAIERSSWITGFQAGLVGVLLAAKDSELKNISDKCKGERSRPFQETCDFVERWLTKPPDSRVFVAFTRNDVAVASKVKKALEDEGYAVFVYLRDNSATPWANPKLVGEAFAQSRHKLVIDTQNSRGSDGVNFEALCSCEALLSPPGRLRGPR